MSIPSIVYHIIYNSKKKQTHISPYLKELHFLPVLYRIQFKIATMVYKAINNIGPDYISDMISVELEKNIEQDRMMTASY